MLRRVLEYAREAEGVAQELIEAGEQRLAELKKLAAEKELQEATQGTDIPALEKALEQAKKVGVAQELIEAGAQKWQELSGYPLREATQGIDFAALDKAVKPDDACNGLG